MQTNLQIIFVNVRQSSLPLEAQKRLMGYLSRTGDDTLTGIAEAFKRDPSWIPRFFEHLTSKVKALQSRNQHAFREAIQKEVEDIRTTE